MWLGFHGFKLSDEALRFHEVGMVVDCFYNGAGMDVGRNGDDDLKTVRCARHFVGIVKLYVSFKICFLT